MPIAIDFDNHIHLIGNRCLVTCHDSRTHTLILWVPNHNHPTIVAVLFNPIPRLIGTAVVDDVNTTYLRANFLNDL